MIKKYSFADGEIYHGEAMRVLMDLPNNSVDAVLTDPPYCSGAFTLMGKQQGAHNKYQRTGAKAVYSDFVGDCRDQRSFTMWCSMWLGECLRVAKSGSPLMVFTDWRQLPAVTDAVQCAGWAWRGLVTWQKPIGRPHKGEFRRDAEFIVYARKGGLPADLPDVYLPGVYNYSAPRGNNRVHLTQKPVELIKDLLKITRPGDIVLDPFLGSGTTAVACHEMGRRFEGCEITEDNIKITIDRLNIPSQVSLLEVV